MKLNLNEFIDKRRAEASVTLEIPDGDPIVIPPPELWAATVTEIRKDLRRGKADLNDLGRALIGDDEFERWSAAVEQIAPGASPGDVLNQAFDYAVKQQQGVAPGES